MAGPDGRYGNKKKKRSYATLYDYYSRDLGPRVVAEFCSSALLLYVTVNSNCATTDDAEEISN